MTEKRFTVPKNYRCIQDNLTKEHYLCEDKTEAINLAYLLNELADENEKLKQELYTCHTFLSSKTMLENHNEELTKENEQLKQYNQRITKVLEDGGVILTKNQLKSLIEMNNDDSVEVRYLKTANAKLKDEISALKEYIQKKEVIK